MIMMIYCITVSTVGTVSAEKESYECNGKIFDRWSKSTFGDKEIFKDE